MNLNLYLLETLVRQRMAEAVARARREAEVAAAEPAPRVPWPRRRTALGRAGEWLGRARRRPASRRAPAG